MDNFKFDIPTLPISTVEPKQPVNLTEIFEASKACKDCGKQNPCTNCGEKVLLI
jgi:hypothetical protein